MLIGLLTFGLTFGGYAQDEAPADGSADTTTTEVADAPAEEAPAEEPQEAVEEEAANPLEAPEDDRPFHQRIKEKFIEGDPLFMAPVLICLIIGLAVAIERIIALNLASSNPSKLLQKVEEELKAGGIKAAQNAMAASRGPVASIFTQGLLRSSEGIEMVEKSVISYGSVEMSKLERGLVWISLFISLAPMLGFMGTVIGMIGAFDAIEAAGDISPGLVAGGIKVALLTTVAGLIVAIILQIFYNYCVSRIDAIVGQMEEASISLIDLLIKYDMEHGGNALVKTSNDITK